ncbi:hypothetical protein [Phenylobacterium deserti]|uniref:Uncharacterized protein n=1 Tax=Phenylobacterium deserti TaxID=1914756 RepID=A0A328AP03_9CAUL|nr:hypothetical protein [Phenylobacterium deserti]RAK56680.1 hypothetical protein DJ018_01495 [Phenylobacterium deserti]
MRRRLQAACAAALLAWSLAGCSTLGPKPKPSPVVASAPAPPPAEPEAAPPPPPKPRLIPRKAPAPVSCVPKNFPRAPRYPDSDAALKNAAGAADRYQLMAAGRLLRMQRLAALERALEACR